jgi:hypothetical protein
MSFFDKMIATMMPPESEEDHARARREARSETMPGDWLDQVLQHHEQIEAAFARAGNATGSAERTRELNRLAALLTAHSSAEETVIYPQLSHDHKLHLTLACEEQQAVKVELSLLELLDPLSADWVDKLGHVKGAVAHHVYEEEGNRFLRLKRELPAEAQTHMTTRYREEIGRYNARLPA